MKILHKILRLLLAWSLLNQEEHQVLEVREGSGSPYGILQEAAASKTPDWGVQATPRDSDETAKEAEKGSKPPKAAPKSWRGIGEFKVGHCHLSRRGKQQRLQMMLAMLFLPFVSMRCR